MKTKVKSLSSITVILIIISFTGTLALSNHSFAQNETGNLNYYLKTTVQYSNPSSDKIWNFSQRGEYDRTILRFMNNSWQTVELLNSTLPVEAIISDEDGNSGAVLKFPKPVLIPGDSLNWTAWYHIVSKPRDIPLISENESQDLTDIPPSLDSYTVEEGSWRVSNATLKQLAQNLTLGETKVLTVIKSFVTWIKANVKYPPQEEQHENPQYPDLTYASRDGDCDDQAILLITLCRIVGIPAYLRIGCIYQPHPNYFENLSIWNGHATFVERRVGWHGWAVVYVPPWGWLPVDLTYVTGGFNDPLDSIRHGAVTLQNTTQYMDVVHSDYVGISLGDQQFLESNGFKVYSEYEMIQETKVVNLDTPIPIALVAFAVPVVFAVVLIIRHRRNKRTSF